MSLPANYPSSLDSLANPGSTTETDDPGFELDLVVSRIHALIQQLEAKVGIGASLPSAAGVLRRTSGSSTAWGQVVAADILAASLTTDLLAANAATKIWSASTGSVTNSATTMFTIQTITTPDWSGGPGFAVWTPYVNHSQLSASWGLYYRTDAGSNQQMVTGQASVASVAIPAAGVYPIPAGVPAGSRAHTFSFQTNLGVSWTIAGGYIIIVELRR